MLSVAAQEVHCGNVVDKMDTPPKAKPAVSLLLKSGGGVGGGTCF